MSIAASAWAKRQTAANAAGKALLMVLADYCTVIEGYGPRSAQGRHYGWPGLARLAEESQQSERSVIRHLIWLEERDLLRRERRHDAQGRRMSDWLILPVGDEGEQPFTPCGQPVDEEPGESTMDQVTGCQVTPEQGPSDNGCTDTYIGTTKEPPPFAADAAAEVVDAEIVEDPPQQEQRPETAQTILAGFLDWLKKPHGEEYPPVLMPKNLVGWYAKSIKDCLDSGIDPRTVRQALTRMRQRGITSRPSLLAQVVVEVQAGKPTQRTSAYPMSATQVAAEEAKLVAQAGALIRQAGADLNDLGLYGRVLQGLRNGQSPDTLMETCKGWNDRGSMAIEAGLPPWIVGGGGQA